jgi:hypothetical protein
VTHGSAESQQTDNEGWITFVARSYFSPLETGEARRILQETQSYQDALAYLVGVGEDLRLTPVYTTTPNGKVLIAEPGRPADSLAYIPVPLIELARRAFPDPHATEARDSLDQSGSDDQRQGRNTQLSFWEESELRGEERTGQQDTSQPAAVRKTPSARSKKVLYVEQTIARVHCAPQPGWVARDRGLGYLVVPMRPPNSGHVVSLIHLKSRREMASVLCDPLDHERIRMWICTCLPLTDWTRGIQALLKEQQGEQKQRSLTARLEEFWYQQTFTVKRQLAFF